jgi:predicted metal-dependent HD superfamily phosphohydrolase
MNERLAQLQSRWHHLWARLGAAPAKAPPLTPLVQAYESAGRTYHNLHHISQCLAELDALRDACQKPDELELAIWYHDVIYDAKRHDNEESSADAAAKAMREAGVDQAVIDSVISLILATKHTAPPAPGDAKILVDIDLSILGRPQVEFDVYEEAIRKEYSFVDETSFRAGRSAILRKFLDRDVIYNTEVMRQKYDAAARENLRRSIEKLSP